MRKYHLANKAKKNEQSRQWWAANKDRPDYLAKRKVHTETWRAANKEAMKVAYGLGIGVPKARALLKEVDHGKVSSQKIREGQPCQL